MATICAWCRETIEKVAAARRAVAISHGICPACLRRQLESIQAAPRSRTV